MGVKQISVFVENKVGNLAEVAGVISEANISLRAISLADTRDFGILRLIVDDTYNAANVLREKGYIITMTSVIAIEAEDAPGSLNKVLTLFGENDINLEYLYDVNSGIKDVAYIVFKVNETERATELLKKNNIKLLTQENF